MIHYGKTPYGDLELRVSADDIGEVLSALGSSGLLARRTFNGLREYIKKEFAEELARHELRMTAQIPVAEEGGGHAAV